MSSSYSAVSRYHHILHKMLNIARTESFELVREQFFKSYINNVAAEGIHQPSEKFPNAFVPPKKTPWETAASNFASSLKIAYRPKCHDAEATALARYTHAQELMTNPLDAKIQELISGEGTPYQRVGRVLAWFKEWRAEKRKQYSSHPNDGFDTTHVKLQNAMTQLLLDVSHAMVADEKYAPATAFHIFRGQPKTTVCSDPTPTLEHPVPTGTSPYSRAQDKEERREIRLRNTERYREQLEHTSHWAITIDWSWRSQLCGSPYDMVHSKSVPPIYTLGRYLLASDASTWNREHVCNALIMEKTFKPNGSSFQCGLDIGLAPSASTDVQAYQAWWKEQERQSAKDWRYIRRSSALLTPYGKIDAMSVGDAVARLKKNGPVEVVTGIFRSEDQDIKALLLDRVQAGLGQEYAILKQVEDTMGPMPDVVIESLEKKIKGNDAHAEIEFDMGSLLT